MNSNIFLDLSSNRLELNMDDIPVPSENTFDVTLPAAHSYLGQNLEELRGRTILDDGIYINLPLLVKQSVLFPGQTLPMTVFGTQTIEMLQTCIQNDRTFGVVCYGNPDMERIGTTAEIYEYTDGGIWLDHGRREFRLKAKGRQRFKILRIITQKKELLYLGHVISDKGVRPNPEKVQAIRKYLIPKNHKELKQFLGLFKWEMRQQDHKPLIWLFNVKDPSSRLMRWRLKLEEYDYEVLYKDTYITGNINVIKKKHLIEISLITKENKQESINLETIFNCLIKLKEYVISYNQKIISIALIENIISKPKITQIIKYKERNCVPSGQRKATHIDSDSPEAPGAWLGGSYASTLYPDLTPSDYHLFLSMANDFADEKFASREACENRLSQFFTNRDEGFYERDIMELPSKWQQVIEQNGAQDQLTKFCTAYPLLDTNSTTIADTIINKFIYTFGAPAKLFSDQGSNISGEMIKEVARIFKIKQVKTSVYHLQSNGSLERSHHELAEYLKPFVNDNNKISANVKVLPEITLEAPFLDQRLASLDHLRISVDSEEDMKKQERVENLDAAVTAWPAWVYRQYDPIRLSFRIRQHLQFLETRGGSVPKNPIDLSFWVAQNILMDHNERLTLLTYDCAISRLQREIKYLVEDKIYVCVNCESFIGRQSHMFPMNKEGPQGSYVNPGGVIHETITFYHVQGVLLNNSDPSTEYSWFPGYAWTIAICKGCRHHVGWKFTAVQSNLRPKEFWGLTRRSLKNKDLKIKKKK
ncbi:CRBN protein, partial [Pseudoatta argentina]